MSKIALTVNSRDPRQLSTTIEALINMLDDLEGDADFEDAADCDLEPWLGASEYAGGVGNWETTDGGSDREAEDEHGGDICDERHDASDSGDDEPNGDEEPWLGAAERHPSNRRWGDESREERQRHTQTCWGDIGDNDDREDENEHGDVCDLPRDGFY